MKDPKSWVKSYFSRLETVINELKHHTLINHVNCVQFSGISNNQIAKIEDELNQSLLLNKDPNYVQSSFKFDDYMKEFYKISNGLHISWDSHIIESELETSTFQKNSSKSDFIVATDSIHEAEGFLSLIPMENLSSFIGLNIYGDPSDSRLGEEITKKGGYFTYLDYFNFYRDTCLGIMPDSEIVSLLYFGEDCSAVYDPSNCSDFVIYMEHLLTTYFSVFMRKDAFFHLDEVKLKRSEFYEKIQSNIYSIDEIIKLHVIDKDLFNKFGDLNYLESKEDKTYKEIELLLNINIKDELDL